MQLVFATFPVSSRTAPSVEFSGLSLNWFAEIVFLEPRKLINLFFSIFLNILEKTEIRDIGISQNY